MKLDSRLPAEGRAGSAGHLPAKKGKAIPIDCYGGYDVLMESRKAVTATIFNIQRFAVQDGPGIRTTVFLKGCPLKCLWCSNPESQSSTPEVAHRDSLCIGCGQCVKTCTQEAVRLILDNGAPKVKIDRQKCNNCGQCVETCKGGSLKVYGQTMSVDEVFDEARRDVAFYVESEGGVTVSGGEPLSQADFVVELFRRCRRIGIHTTVDTCGDAPVTELEKVLPETDLFLFDLKLMDSQEHQKFTKRVNKAILRNLRLIIEKGVPLIIRIPFIPGVNDSEKNLEEVARFVAELDQKRHVDLLPYHRFGEGKYKMLDKDYELTDVRSPDEEQLTRAMEIFKRYNLDCAIQE